MMTDPRIEAREYTFVSAHYRDPYDGTYLRPWEDGDPVYFNGWHQYRESSGLVLWHRDLPEDRWTSRVERFLVMTPLKSEAAPGAERYAQRFGTPTEIHYYPRNYVVAARELFRQDRVVEWCIDCNHDQLHCTCEHVDRCSCGHTGVCPCAEW